MTGYRLDNRDREYVIAPNGNRVAVPRCPEHLVEQEAYQWINECDIQAEEIQSGARDSFGEELMEEENRRGNPPANRQFTNQEAMPSLTGFSKHLKQSSRRTISASAAMICGTGDPTRN